MSSLPLTALAALTLAVAATPAFAGPDEASLRAADAAQHAAARTRDADALERMMHPGFIVNSPEGEVWDKARTVGLWRSRGIGHDRFERTVEHIQMDGDVGVVAGRETVEPSTDSLAGRRRADGGQPVQRRFTNVWLWKDGRWQFFARHANEMPAKAAAKP